MFSLLGCVMDDQKIPPCCSVYQRWNHRA